MIADTAGKFASAEVVTADFVYVRLHGSSALYASDYTDEELERWATKVKLWVQGEAGRDVYVYFDNDAKVHAPAHRDSARGSCRIAVTLSVLPG